MTLLIALLQAAAGAAGLAKLLRSFTMLIITGKPNLAIKPNTTRIAKSIQNIKPTSGVNMDGRLIDCIKSFFA